MHQNKYKTKKQVAAKIRHTPTLWDVIESCHTMRPEIIIQKMERPPKKLDSRDPPEDQKTALRSDQYHSNIGRT